MGNLSHLPTWTQPSMFPLEDFPLPQITIDFAVHLDGPSGRVQTWVTVRDPATVGAISVASMPAYSIDAAVEGTTEIVADAIREALRALLPF